MVDETTTEQLAEIEEQAAEYTPPEGWRVLAAGERLQAGDMTVRKDGYCYSTERVGYFVGANQRYIRRIEQEPEPEPQPQPQPEPVQVREGRWRTRSGEVKNIRPCEPLKGAHFVWPWTDGFMTFQDNGRHLAAESDNDLVEYLGPIEPEPQPETQPEPEPDAGKKIRRLQAAIDERAELGESTQTRAELQARIRELETIRDTQAATIKELSSEVSHVQRLLGESRQRVTQLEELVGSLRTINDAQEKSVRLAGQENTDLKHRLDVVSAEWAEQAGMINGLRAHVEAVEDDVVQQRLERNRYQNQVLRLTAELDNKTTECRNLQIELDALQQAPQAETMAATPPATEDRFEQGWDAGTARAVETIAEWTEPFRTCGSERLAWMVMQNLPHIMRTLTGLTPED